MIQFQSKKKPSQTNLRAAERATRIINSIHNLVL
jgi:hypothetical protein